MPEGTTHLAIFNEVDPVAEAIHELRELGIPDNQMNIISGLPYSAEMLGREKSWSMIPKFSIIGFVLGFVLSIVLNWGSVLQYPLIVGNLPLFAIPTTIIVTFELSMLGLLLFTFLGVVWENAWPSWGKKVYRKDVSDGKIAIEFICPPEIHTRVHEMLGALGAEWVHRTEATEI